MSSSEASDSESISYTSKEHRKRPQRERSSEQKHEKAQRTSRWDRKPVPMKSVEGWALFVANIHPETQEEDLFDTFADYGDIVKVDLILCRRTGQAIGYALVEFKELEHAQRAKEELNEKSLFGRPLQVDWAIVEPPEQ